MSPSYVVSKGIEYFYKTGTGIGIIGMFESISRKDFIGFAGCGIGTFMAYGLAIGAERSSKTALQLEESYKMIEEYDRANHAERELISENLEEIARDLGNEYGLDLSNLSQSQE